MAIFKAVCCLLLAGFLVEAFDPYAPTNSENTGEHEVTLDNVAFLIRSQPNRWHLERAQEVKADIEQQARLLKLGTPKVILLHEKYGARVKGYWTILALLPKLHADFGNYKWLFFCEEDSRVILTGLLSVLSRYNSQEDLFLGRALRDKSATIIHHYRFLQDSEGFLYPDLEAGWLLSQQLLKSLATRWEGEEHKADFTIDVKHEVAYYIWNDDKGTSLTHVPELCAGNVGLNLEPHNDESLQYILDMPKHDPQTPHTCVTAHPMKLPQCGDTVSQDDVLITVKTCEKFHTERVPIVQDTWGQFSKNIVYVSDVEDASIPTIASGVPNTERGHCGKLMAIFNMFNEDSKYAKYSWLTVVDDDTILSVSRLNKLLACYSSEDLIVLGERYGYAQLTGYGYDYVTGGGGMVFSRAAVKELLDRGCRCGQDSDPDDMILGMCCKRYDIPITHSPLFHQARPEDYSEGFLQHQTPISFHKHWNNDPIKVYKEWFLKDDSQPAVTRVDTQEDLKKDEL